MCSGSKGARKKRNVFDTIPVWTLECMVKDGELL